MTVKKCKHCKHCVPASIFYFHQRYNFAHCSHSDIIRNKRREPPKFHLGRDHASKRKITAYYCSVARSVNGKCKPEAVYFENDNRTIYQKLRDYFSIKICTK